MFRCALILLLVSSAIHSLPAIEITGAISDQSNARVGGARVTLFSNNLKLFHETRTAADGTFRLQRMGAGTFRLGVAARGFEYQERDVTVSNLPLTEDFILRPETNGGRWSIVGNTAPELLDGTGSGSLLPSGDVFFCHDTEDPVMFSPVAGMKWFPPTSGSGQGCHIPTLNTDGALFLAGGSEDGYPQGLVVKTVKEYLHHTNGWVRLTDMNVPRWYPGIVRFPDEKLMVLGGEQNGSPGRTSACEIYDPSTRRWTNAASFALPSEITPTVLLYSGELFKTWRYPEFYNLERNEWRAAPRMLQARLGASNGDHCDHEIVFLPDGRVMAVGISPTTLTANTRFVEFYNPATQTWSLGPNPRALRRQPEALILPDGRVLAFGGQYSGPNPAPIPLANAGIIPNCTKVCDLYDTATDAWRPMADLNRFIHYHNVTVLVPDGRVIATGGAGLTANNSFAGDDNSIEAFEPPYLFRGVRPRIDWLSTTDLVPGSDFNLRVSLTESVSQVVLVSARATTHWVDGGPQRWLDLEFTESGDTILARTPNDPVRALAGYYILFVLVDDIPSVGRIVRITPLAKPRPALPIVSIFALDSAASEAGTDNGSFRLTRTGSIASPLTVSFEIGGTAENGADYNTLSNFVVIPAGASGTTLTLTPRNDLISEGPETVSLSIFGTSGYDVGSATNAMVTLADDESAPPPLSLSVVLSVNGQIEWTLRGAASRAYVIESSRDLVEWQEFATLLTSENEVRLIDRMPEEKAFFFRARQ
ncbi:MAG: galactose oxidase-like domain-containing protein [Verrucomicrobiota bacterium]